MRPARARRCSSTPSSCSSEGGPTPALVRHGAAECSIEGRFVVDDDEVVLSRVIPRDGRSRAYRNGRLATVAQLAEEGRRLVDLHGQHSHQSLLGVASNGRALDRFGGVDLRRVRALPVLASPRSRPSSPRSAATNVRERERSTCSATRSTSSTGAASRRRRRGPSARDRGGPAGRRSRAPRSRRLERATRSPARAERSTRSGPARAALAGRGAVRRAREQRLHGLEAEAADIAAELRRHRRRHRRRSRAARRGPRPPAPAPRAHPQVRRDARRGHRLPRRGAVTRLECWRPTTRVPPRSTRNGCAAARRCRRGSAPGRRRSPRGCAELATAVRSHLTELALPRARIESWSTGSQATPSTYRLAANPGEDLAPLAEVASGGELARTMLALRLVVTEAPPTLVFDEVDAGIGGQAALAVGRSSPPRCDAPGARRHPPRRRSPPTPTRRSRSTSARRMRARRSVAPAVDGDARAVELSRMLSGMPSSATARDHAEELLAAAARERGR